MTHTKRPPRCCSTRAADKKRELGKTCFSIIVPLGRAIVKGAALLLGWFGLCLLCEGGVRNTLSALAAWAGCSRCIGLACPAPELAEREAEQ